MSNRAPARTPVIIDTDPGVDDALAILLALASPELEILAIVISFGNTDVDASYLNIFRIFRALDQHLKLHPEERSRFPNFEPSDPSKRPLLVKGASMPLEGDLHSAIYFHGRDGLANMSQRHPDLHGGDSLLQGADRYLRVVDEPCVDVALGLLRAWPARSITYIPLGPLTNLANLVRADAALVRQKIGRVVCMGGALDVPGNTSPVAEFNWFADPYAVRELLVPGAADEVGLPLDRFILLPLDITTPHELPFPLYQAQIDAGFESTARPSAAADKPPLHHFTSAFLERTREVMCDFGKDALELHDPVAVWCAIANPPVAGENTSGRPGLAKGWQAVKRKFNIERTGELTRGMCVVDRREDASAYAPGANRAQVQAALDLQHYAHAGGWESTAVPAQVEVEGVAKTRPAEQPGQVNAWDREAEPAKGGVWCITETPGPDHMLRLLVQRIWGVVLQ